MEGGWARSYLVDNTRKNDTLIIRLAIHTLEIRLGLLLNIRALNSKIKFWVS
jgi:hypothetical protein